MRRVACLLLGLTIAGSAFAQTRADPGICDGWAGSPDERISACSHVIAADARSSEGLSRAHDHRGVAWSEKGDQDRAIADFTAALRIDPRDSFAYGQRALAWYAAGDMKRALADANELIRLLPKEPAPFFIRGILHFYDANYADAAGDFEKALKGERRIDHIDMIDAALWLYLARQRGGDREALARLAAETRDMPSSKWPAPLLDFYLGKVTQGALADAADNPDPKIRRERRCAMNFYGGEWMLTHGRVDQAKRMLLGARGDCPVPFLFSWTAQTELSRLEHPAH